MNYKYTKSVGYAYPTSQHATDLGHGDDGCWFYAFHTKDGPARATQGFKTAREAYDYAYNIDMPWNSFWLNCLNSCKTTNMA